jgi:hypothetical protein
MGMRSAFTPRSIARMPTHRAPMMNSALGLRRFNRFNGGDFDRDDRFHHFNHFKEIIFVRTFGFPWWWGPWWGWNWGYYPYGSYGYSEYSYPSASGYDYGYGYPSGSYYGSYYSATNYENDDESAVRNVLAEYTVSWNRHDTAAFGRLFTEDGDYVNIARCPLEGSAGDSPAARGTVSEEIKDRRSDSYRCRSSFFNARCCTCPCYVGRNRLESSHWKGRSSSERNHYDGDGQN